MGLPPVGADEAGGATGAPPEAAAGGAGGNPLHLPPVVGMAEAGGRPSGAPPAAWADIVSSPRTLDAPVQVPLLGDAQEDVAGGSGSSPRTTAASPRAAGGGDAPALLNPGVQGWVQAQVSLAEAGATGALRCDPGSSPAVGGGGQTSFCTEGPTVPAVVGPPSETPTGAAGPAPVVFPAVAPRAAGRGSAAGSRQRSSSRVSLATVPEVLTFVPSPPSPASAAPAAGIGSEFDDDEDDDDDGMGGSVPDPNVDELAERVASDWNTVTSRQRPKAQARAAGSSSARPNAETGDGGPSVH